MTRARLAVLLPLTALCVAAPPARAATADEARGDGPRVRPPVTVITDARPAWVASRTRWGASRAAWWNPAEQSSPLGPRFQVDGRWTAPAAFHDGARSCASGPPGYPWWAFAGLGGLALLVIAAILRRRTSPAC